MIFTSEVVGTDGARAKLRHEQNGFGLMFGGSGGFLTPNMSDVRSPIVVLLHGGSMGERYEVSLLEDSPRMPSAREMMQIVATDPIAQARYFILSMRLFCEHVLGLGPFDDCLRHNGSAGGPTFPDGFAASGRGGAFGMIAACHGPIEEQARLSIHPHIVLWFAHGSSSEAWLRSILKRETEEARALLRGWQEKVLAYVQSIQLDSAAVLPLLLEEDPELAETPRSTPFSSQHQKDCRFDGELEGDARDASKRRPLVATEACQQASAQSCRGHSISVHEQHAYLLIAGHNMIRVACNSFRSQHVSAFNVATLFTWYVYVFFTHTPFLLFCMSLPISPIYILYYRSSSSTTT